MSCRTESGFPALLRSARLMSSQRCDLVGIEGRCPVGTFAEDVRMAAYELVAELLEHVVDGEGARFGADLAVKQHLEQHVAQLFLELGEVASIDGIERFVGLLDEVGLQRLVGLLSIPGQPPGARRRAMIRTTSSKRADMRIPFVAPL